MSKISEKNAKAVDLTMKLLNEVDCRIEHGANSGGHLEYVRDRLIDIVNLANEAFVE